MKKFLIFLAIVLLLGTGYFTYDKWVRESNLNTWSLVPPNSILVYESQSLLATFDEIQKTGIWKNLSTIKRFADLPRQLNTLDTLAGKGNFVRYFSDIPVLIALNVTTSKDFDFLYIAEIRNLSQQTYISKALAHFKKLGYTSQTREYLGFTITDIVNRKNDVSFTYIFYKNYFIGSFTAFLVEDAIRTISQEHPSFQKQYPELIPVIKLKEDQGNVYFNFTRYPDLINLFSSGLFKANVATSAFLDLRISDDAVNMNGFTFTSQPKNFFTIFQEGTGAGFDMTEVIPNSTAWMHHLTFTEGATLAKALNDYFGQFHPEVVNKKNQLLQSIDFDVNYTFQLLDEEIGVVTLENSRNREPDRLLVLEIADMGAALNFFNSVGERIAIATGDSVYIERFGDIEIRKLPVNNFPYALLGDMAAGFDQSFYISYRNYLIFCNSIYPLKALMASIENEDTWNRSLKFNSFLERANKEANYSLFVNTPRAWSQLLQELKPEWQAYAHDYQFTLRNLEYLAFQFSNVDRTFYTNITLFQPDLPSIAPSQIKAEKSILLSADLTTKPFLVINHNDKSREVMVQDSLNNVYLISAALEALWSKGVDGAVTSGFYQIDYYKNGKLQYLFATEKSIYLFDRNGELLPEFPVQLPSAGSIQFLRVFDYDKSRNYRYAIADTNGNIYLTDKNGKSLEGWAPKKLDGPLAAAPEHIRINGKDLIIGMQQNGKIHLWNRKGDNAKNFPINLETDLDTRFYVDGGSTLANSGFTTVTAGGEIIRLNLEGRFIRRDQLYKPSVSTVYSLIKDVSGNGYILIRNTENRYEVLNESGATLFEKDYFSSQPMITQYYRLGGGVEWIIFVDPGGRYLYIYDPDGSLVTGRPLTAGTPLSIVQYENRYELYQGTDAELSIVNFPK